VRVIAPGHKYALRNMDGDGEQILTFVRRIPAGEAHKGVLLQEVMRVLIDRIFFLYQQVPCEEDTRIIEHLRECIVLLETRASRRSIEHILYPEREPVCGHCGHMLCFHKEN
jgi:hypothetical protein